MTWWPWRRKSEACEPMSDSVLRRKAKQALRRLDRIEARLRRRVGGIETVRAAIYCRMQSRIDALLAEIRRVRAMRGRIEMGRVLLRVERSAAPEAGSLAATAPQAGGPAAADAESAHP